MKGSVIAIIAGIAIAILIKNKPVFISTRFKPDDIILWNGDIWLIKDTENGTYGLNTMPYDHQGGTHVVARVPYKDLEDSAKIL